MSVAENLQRLARMVPGIAGYQDRERSRETDKAIRLRLAAELEQIKRDLEEDKRRLIEKKDLSLLPALDQAASKLDRLGSTITYAARGYRGFFDTYRLDQEKLDRLYAFDLGLFEELASLKARAKQLRDSHHEVQRLRNAAAELDQSLDRLGEALSKREHILTSQ